MKLSYLLLSLCLIPVASQAAEEMEPLVITRPSAAAEMPEAVPYRYGMQLDIDKVISIHEPDEMTCEAVTATMVYEDSSETRRALSYLKVPSSCSRWG